MPRFGECWRCAKKNTSVVCRFCNVAKYCSPKCQINDKVRHKVDCRAAAVVKRCLACKQSGSTLQRCAVCYRADYCDRDCQKKDWPRHKTECDKIKKKIFSLGEWMSNCFPKICNKHYYWGTTPAVDCVNLPENEGNDFISTLNILFLGVGDLRNVVLTTASLPESYQSHVKFTLNDIDHFALARLVLLLYMLKRGVGQKSSPHKNDVPLFFFILCNERGDPEVEKAVIEVWYSVSLSETTFSFLSTSLQELNNIASCEALKRSTNGLLIVQENHLKALKLVWQTWFNLCKKGTSWIRQQRLRAMDDDLGSAFGKQSYYNCIPSEHVKSAKKWMEDGVFHRTRSPLCAENPTLTGRPVLSGEGPFSYCCPTDDLPFTGWDYLQVKKFKHSDSLIAMYGGYIEGLLRRFLKRLSANKVSCRIVLSNCMNIGEFIQADTKYDRVLTSNLMDYILLPDLLKLCSEKLNHRNPHATIVMETNNWTRNFCPEADFSSPANIMRTFEFTEMVTQDTHNYFIARDGGTGFREYLDNAHEFSDFLRALFYAGSVKKETGAKKASSSSHRRKLPSARELGNEFQLRLRDYLRNENKIVFFKYACNCRRVTMITGLERFLEWTPLQKE